jgi:TonB family protein
VAMQRAYTALPAWAQPAFGPAALGNPLVWMAPAALTCLFGATGGLRMAGLAVFFLALRRVFSGGVRLAASTVFWALLLLAAWAVAGNALSASASASSDLDPTAPLPYTAPDPGSSGMDPVTVTDVDGAASIVGPRLMDPVGLAQLVARHYPPLLRHDGVAGEVRLRFLVRDDGTVDTGTITVLSSTAGAFDLAATAVLGETLFSPAASGGKPIATWVETTIRFEP